MKFELGFCYKHSSGSEKKIVGIADSTIYGIGFVSENPFGEYSICGMKEENTIGWKKISNEEWMKNFSSEI